MGLFINCPLFYLRVHSFSSFVTFFFDSPPKTPIASRIRISIIRQHQQRLKHKKIITSNMDWLEHTLV